MFLTRAAKWRDYSRAHLQVAKKIGFVEGMSGVVSSSSRSQIVVRNDGSAGESSLFLLHLVLLSSTKLLLLADAFC